MDVDEDLVAALSVPHLVAGEERVLEDGPRAGNTELLRRRAKATEVRGESSFIAVNLNALHPPEGGHPADALDYVIARHDDD